MRVLIQQGNPRLTKNENLKVEETIKRLYSLFDHDKNGILDLNEVISSLSILCKGSLEAKLQALSLIADNGFSFKDLKNCFLSIFKLALETNKEVRTGFSG